MTHRILIVDDEPNIVTSLEFLMRQNAFDVRSVSTGDAALAEVERFLPDVMLLDLMLPGQSGFEVCRQVRANPQLARVRIVVLTARGQAAEQAQGLALGVDAYVLKPFSTREVVKTVCGLLR